MDDTTRSEFVPAERHKGRYADRVLQRRPNYGFSAEERATKPEVDAPR
jgi:hypothetical protein